MDFFARVSDSGFTSNRLLDYRANALIPILHGHFVQTPLGTDIQVRMHPPLINLMILALLVAFIAQAAVSDILRWFSAGQSLDGTGMLLAIAAFLCLMPAFLFAPEARLAEEFLRSVYEQGEHDQWLVDPAPDEPAQR